jgi:hypothetical protein
MEVTQLESLAKMRAVIGCLGEREQYAWWQSSFFSFGSQAFLTPAFARTAMLAQCMGVTRAAALVHDERIGVGRVYHLFRLPEDIEQGIHGALHAPEIHAQIAALVAHKDAALEYLRTQGQSLSGSGVGPVEIGHAHDIRDQRSWQAVAAHYFAAFSVRADVYPYFTDRV